MSTTKNKALILLTATALLITTATSIGVNYGTLGNDLPTPKEVAKFLRTKTTIDQIRIFDTSPEILEAFADTNISVTVNAGNGDIAGLAVLDTAKKWVEKNIKPYYPKTKIIRILLGNEIMQSANKEWINNLVPAMKTVHEALVDAGIKDVQVSTPNTLGFLTKSTSPSEVRFIVGYDKDIIAPMLKFLSETKSPLMINPYPFFSYSQNMSNFALFKPNEGVRDNSTKITYSNMFDAQMDAVYSSMKALGHGDDVDIVVAETGWPSHGGPDHPECTVENAKLYNGNVLKRVTSGEGTPLMPKRRFETYIFALFNENQKPGEISEKNFGLFQPDFTPVYDIGIMRNETLADGPANGPEQSPQTLKGAPSPAGSPGSAQSPTGAKESTGPPGHASSGTMWIAGLFNFMGLVSMLLI